MPPVPLGIARSTPPDGVPNVYAVNIGSSGAAEYAYALARASDTVLELETKATSLLKYGRRLPHLWP